jgi:peptidoglycan/LPS O-acetylase OafA/YrhL
MFLAMHAAQGSYLVETGPHVFLLGSPAVWVRFGTYFLAGMTLAHYRQVVPYRAWLCALCLGLMSLSAWAGGFFAIYAVFGVYVLFYFAYQRLVPLWSLGTHPDLSYGTYLYGWPVQALLILKLGGSLGPYGLFAIALPVTLAIAALSWYLVESPWMQRKAQITCGAGRRAQVFPISPEAHPTPAR